MSLSGITPPGCTISAIEPVSPFSFSATCTLIRVTMLFCGPSPTQLLSTDCTVPRTTTSESRVSASRSCTRVMVAFTAKPQSAKLTASTVLKVDFIFATDTSIQAHSRPHCSAPWGEVRIDPRKPLCYPAPFPDEHPSAPALCAFSHRILAYRRCAHSAFQLALHSASSFGFHSSHRRYGSRAVDCCIGSGDSRRTSLAGNRLG